MRSLGAVAAGFVLFAMIVGLFTPIVARTFGVQGFQSFSLPIVAATVTYCVIAAIAGGYLTAWIAGRRELPHAAGLGILMIAVSIWSMRQHGAERPGWYETTIAGCGPVAAFFGAAVRRLMKARPSA